VSPDPTSVFLRGWFWDPGQQLLRLEIVLGHHVQAVPAAGLMRYPRKDVAAHCQKRFSDGAMDNHGFLAFLPTEAPAAAGGLLRVVLKDGQTVELAISPTTDPFLSQRHILESIPSEPFFDAALMANHIAPAIDRVRSGLPGARAARTLSFGSSPSDPELSIVVPLYGRVELMEQQLAQFANDPAISASELIYVLDDPPRGGAEFEFHAFQLAQLYRVPFKVLVMERNSGYSAANNVGAAASSAPFLLFLNSDVFPAKPGWTTRLLAHHNADPHLGALGCKLLYEDCSIQHAGMYFYQDFHPYRLWINMHYFKGLPRDWPEACVERAVPAVTGAALLVRRSVFERVGGWDESYILANYEDSDLCLRFVKHGYTNRYCSSVELYHLERQSQKGAEADPVRINSDFYNRWLQTFRWGGLIEDLMKQYAPASAGGRIQAASAI
jgi:GT2 family glycosyltransferase